jgi:hypothetical protein
MKKTKPHLRKYKVTCSRFGFVSEIEILPSIRSGCHKNFSILNEAKQAFRHKEDEYRKLYKIRGKRTRSGLPNVWDDYPSYVYSMEKSWKYNSRRKKQWFKEKNWEQ